MSLPVYMFEENYQGRPWNTARKMAPHTHTRRISFDSFMDRPKMHSRTTSMDSSISDISGGRNKLQKVCNFVHVFGQRSESIRLMILCLQKSKHNSTPATWSESSSPSNKPLPSLPIWHSQYDVSSEEEYRQRMDRAAEARAEMARRQRAIYAGVVDPEKL
jgi:hypothetical protein